MHFPLFIAEQRELRLLLARVRRVQRQRLRPQREQERPRHRRGVQRPVARWESADSQVN